MNDKYQDSMGAGRNTYTRVRAHGKVEPTPRKPSGKKPYEVVDERNGHQLIRTWRGVWFDYHKEKHGTTIIGGHVQRMTEVEARGRWERKLRQEGAWE